MKSAAIVAVRRGDKILLLQRSETAPWMPCKWALPGGKIERGEKPKEAAKREVREEASLALMNVRYMETFVEDDGYTIYVFQAENNNQEPKLNKEHKGFVWVDVAEITNYDLAPNVRRIATNVLGRYV